MQEDHQRLLGPAGNDDVLCVHQLLVVLFGVTDDRFLQGRNAVGSRVTDFAGIQERSAIDDGVDGRFALRFAATKVDDRLPFLAKERRGFVQFECGRFFQRAGQLTKTHEVTSPEGIGRPGNRDIVLQVW